MYTRESRASHGLGTSLYASRHPHSTSHSRCSQANKTFLAIQNRESDMAKKRSPKVLAAVLVATSIATVSYKIYETIRRRNYEDKEIDSKPNSAATTKQWGTDKSIALTLSHSVLSSDLPLDDILSSSGNVTFILPPYLSIDDLACRVENTDKTQSYKLPQSLIDNYKLLRCSNIEGYFHIVKNLRPDMLYVCSDDLGIRNRTPPDLRRFVKEIVLIDQDRNHVRSVLSKVFLN